MTKELKIMIAIAAVVLLAGVGLMLRQKPSTEPGKQTVTDSGLLAGKESYHTNPARSAKVTVVEFGDFQCPACAAAEPVVKRILETYGANPDFDFVYRHFPLAQHRNAMITAEASEAAGTQGKFWEMKTLLYEKQSEWSNQSDALPTLLGYASSLGLDIEQFKAAIEDRQFQSKILQDARDGQAAGITSTPTFFINNEKFVGVPQAQFETYLQTLLSE